MRHHDRAWAPRSNTARVEPGSTVTVIGCGGVGQSVLQGARIAGASRIFAVDPVEMKRKTAEQFGATDLIDPADGDPVEQVRAATGGRGTDYAFEVIGLPETILQAYEVARRGGTAVVVGMARFDAQVTFPAMSLFAGNKQLLGLHVRLGAGAARLPALRPARGDRPPRHRVDGLAPHHTSTRSTTRSGPWRPAR